MQIFCFPACASFDEFKNFEDRGSFLTIILNKDYHERKVEKLFAYHPAHFSFIIALLIGIGILIIFTASSITANDKFGGIFFFAKKQLCCWFSGDGHIHSYTKNRFKIH